MGSTEGLFEAIDAGDAELVRSMVSADPSRASARDEQGVSALMRARYRSEPALVDAVRSAAPSLDVFEATSLGEVQRLRQLLDADRALAGAYSADGFTALHFAAFFGGERAASILLEAGADLDARGRGWMTGTPLNSAAAGRHADVALVLVEAGADVNARQGTGWTPLHSAAHNGDGAMVELLLAGGADAKATNDDGVSVLAMAEEAGEPAVIARIRRALGA